MSELKVSRFEHYLFSRELEQIAALDGDISASELEKYIALNPADEDPIRQAWLLMHVRPSEENVPRQKIDSDLTILYQKAIRLRGAQRRKIYGVVAGAAAVMLLVFATLWYGSSHESMVPTQMIAGEVNQTIQEIEVRFGDAEPILVDNEAVVSHHSDGTLSVNDQQLGEAAVQSEEISISVPYGRRLTLMLSDGSKLWINSGSKVVYPQIFGQNTRTISVSGEVYLDVARDSSRPFIVTTRDLEVKVLGTSFNISAYQNDPWSNVVLVDGSLEVTAAGDKKLLEPGLMLTYTPGDVSVARADIDYHTSWIHGYIKLNEDKIHDILRRLSRYYNVVFQYDAGTYSPGYHGKLDLTDSLEAALDNLSFTRPFEFTRDGNTVDIQFMK